MTPDIRERMVMMHEGHALTLPGQHGSDEAVAIMKCVIDGNMNALIRTAGPKEASRFAFQLSDRVVGGLRLPTEQPPIEEIKLPRIVQAPSDDRGFARCAYAFLMAVLIYFAWVRHG